MSDFSTELNDAQIERLSLLLEEMGEATQWIGKILRHGYESHDPTRPAQGSNRELLERELGDVLFSIELLTATGDLGENNIDENRILKARTIWKWLHHQEQGRRDYIARWPNTMQGLKP